MTYLLGQYYFWLIIISIVCFLLERVWARRKQQSAFRPQIGQDLFFIIFNGQVFGLLLARFMLVTAETASVYANPDWATQIEKLKILSNLQLPLQFIVFLLYKDFFEWLVHNLLHRVSPLWEIHKLHHSIVDMDWIGNFRFHFLEIVVYKTLLWLPILPLGADGKVLLAVAVFATLIGNLNHANLNWDYGPLKYVFNSPRMHLWHHDVKCHYKSGQNFAIVFSIWDWLFKTIYYPDSNEGDAPEKLGFHDLKKFPESLWMRLSYPFTAPFNCPKQVK